MKKGVICIGTVIIAILLFAVVFNYNWIYYRLYPFDRITGTFSVKLNNKEITTLEQYYEYENNGKIRLENDTKKFDIKAGKYGRYKIGFIVSNDELNKVTNDKYFLEIDDVDLSVTYFNTNWWHVTQIDIEVDFINEKDEWYVIYNVEYTEPTEEGLHITNKILKKIEFDELQNEEMLFGI